LVKLTYEGDELDKQLKQEKYEQEKNDSEFPEFNFSNL